MTAFPAGITQTQVRELEERAVSNELGRARRVVLTTCAADSKTLRGIMDDAPERFAEMMQAADEYRRYTEAATAIARNALARLELIGKDAVQPDLLGGAS